ncbi:hypothetical protein, partial [Sulfitobacter litoralis]|uniref:hypothetical protein n=1 Tax=Sulfitobacter litoralis TaxID=335975 RepID=UPI0030ED4A00
MFLLSPLEVLAISTLSGLSFDRARHTAAIYIFLLGASLGQRCVVHNRKITGHARLIYLPFL